MVGFVIGLVAAAILQASMVDASLPDVSSATRALTITAEVEAETLIDIARDGTVVRVRSNANPPEYRATVLCAYTFTDAPCAVTSGMLDQLATLPLRRRSAYGTVYP